jgi:hypothetical protein
MTVILVRARHIASIDSLHDVEGGIPQCSMVLLAKRLVSPAVTADSRGAGVRIPADVMAAVRICQQHRKVAYLDSHDVVPNAGRNIDLATASRVTMNSIVICIN